MQRYFASDKNNKDFILYESDIHHIKNVMRMNINDIIEIVYNKKTYLCKIIDNINIRLEIIKELEEDNELPCEIIIACALVSEQKQDLILQKLTELGMSTYIPLKMERSIVKIDNKKEEKKLLRWQKICKEASEQSKRNIVPKIMNITDLKELVKMDAPLKLVLSTKEIENTINSTLQIPSTYDRIIIAIGPEGGITNAEEDFLNKHGFKSISLGKRILRVETAAIYITSVINYINMR